jgi:tetratricopeptide (TPR) repeat protein
MRSSSGWVMAMGLSACLCALAAPSGVAHADPEPPAAEPAPPLQLEELPKLEPIHEASPDPEDLARLDALLSRLTSEDARERELAVPPLAEASKGMVAAIRVRVQAIRETLDRDKAPILLDNARQEARKRRKEKEQKGKELDEPDWLTFMLADARPADDAWRDLVRLLAMANMLATVGDTPACRLLIEFRAYFGDMLRVDLERKLVELKDRAVPALLEARRHDAKVVQRMADKLLDRMGRAIPGEAVASNDPEILADVLRAFGRTRDVDAARVVLSFANHERAVVRAAAREAIGAIGEPAKWQLRDAYLGLTGEKPAKAKSWETLAKEIFAMYDRMRLAEIYSLYEAGTKAAASGEHAAAVESFDKVLARDPLFDKRAEMAPSYVAFARQEEEQGLELALTSLRKALRLLPEGADTRAVESQIAYLEARRLMERGVPDRFLFEKALELDPDNDRAREALASFEERVEQREESYRRYFYAGGVLLAALTLLIALARRRPRPPGGGAPPERPPSAPAQTETAQG